MGSKKQERKSVQLNQLVHHSSFVSNFQSFSDMGKQTKLQPGKLKHRHLGRHQHRQKLNTEINQTKAGWEVLFLIFRAFQIWDKQSYNHKN
jgi:hypothetical protein